jgi:hypothetical protein
MLSQNNNISLRGVWKSARRRACVLGRAWLFRYKDIDHILNIEHGCAILRLPGAMLPMLIFTYRDNSLYPQCNIFEGKCHAVLPFLPVPPRNCLHKIQIMFVADEKSGAQCAEVCGFVLMVSAHLDMVHEMESIT